MYLELKIGDRVEQESERDNIVPGEELKKEYERTKWGEIETDSKELLAKGEKNLKVPKK